MPTEAAPDEYVPREDEELSTAIVKALSDSKGRDVTQEECVLYDSIDPDALDLLFNDKRHGDTVKVEFATHDAIVVLWGNDDLVIEIQDLETDPGRE